jgi:plastocyanin
MPIRLRPHKSAPSLQDRSAVRRKNECSVGGGGSDSTTGPMEAQGNTVTVGNNFFSPADLSVAAGTTVT